MIEPVGITGTSFTSVLFIRMIDPLPKSFSIFCITALSQHFELFPRLSVLFLPLWFLFFIINFVVGPHLLSELRRAAIGRRWSFLRAACRVRSRARDGDLVRGSDS